MKYVLLFLCSLFVLQTAHSTEPKVHLSAKDVQSAALRLDPGDDIKQSLENFAKKYKVNSGCVLTCVGSVKNVRLRFAAQPNIDSLQGPFEIVSLTGTVAESGVHLHISFSDSQGDTKGGHLENGTTVFMTAEIMIAIVPDIVFSREADPKTGFSKLLINSNE